MKKNLLKFTKSALVEILELKKHCWTGLSYSFFASLGFIGGTILTPNSLLGIAFLTPFSIKFAEKCNRVTSKFFDNAISFVKEKIDAKLEKLRTAQESEERSRRIITNELEEDLTAGITRNNTARDFLHDRRNSNDLISIRENRLRYFIPRAEDRSRSRREQRFSF